MVVQLALAEGGKAKKCLGWLRFLYRKQNKGAKCVEVAELKAWLQKSPNKKMPDFVMAGQARNRQTDGHGHGYRHRTRTYTDMDSDTDRDGYKDRDID